MVTRRQVLGAVVDGDRGYGVKDANGSGFVVATVV